METVLSRTDTNPSLCQTGGREVGHPGGLKSIETLLRLRDEDDMTKAVDVLGRPSPDGGPGSRASLEIPLDLLDLTGLEWS